MGSAVLNKPPSPFITFIYCFLLISSLFYIPHRIVAEYVKAGASSVHGSSPKHDSNAVGQVPPKKSSPIQNNPHSVKERCGASYPFNRGCLQNSRVSRINESGESMYNWVPPAGRH
ncbi:hypothetical protein QYF36_000533 [Acer negundo]|nr:hypothetical protein QYF36_000533 [Acer negundo]